MELMEIIQAVVQVGFPVVCSIFFLMRLSKQDDRHAQQFYEMRKAVDNNTKVINELLLEIRKKEE